jgi:hypothetical protein
MNARRKESVVEILFSRIIGIVIFLILLGILNLLAGTYIHNPIFLQIVVFLNDNVGLLILITVLLLSGDLFSALAFPLNLPGPVFNAVGALFIVTFIIRLFLLVDDITGIGVFSILASLAFIIYPLVFIIALISGYVTIFTRLQRNE